MKKISRKTKIKIMSIAIFAFMMLMTITTTNAVAIEWWDKASSWYKAGESNVGISTDVLDGLATTLEVVGTGVIAVATVVIGIKYIMGTVEGKVQAKESLMNLLVACIFFFGWSGIRGMLITGNASGIGGIKGSNTGLSFFDGDIGTTFARVFTLLVMFGKVLTVLAVVYMGVRYVFAGADAKAQLKQKSPALIIGIVLIFCATTFLGLLANVINDVL